MGANLRFPPLFKDDGSPDETTTNAIINYQKEACSKDDTERVSRFVNNEKKRFTVGSQPWVDVPAGRDLDEPFVEPTVADDIVLVSQNEIAPIVDSEASRLIGSTSEPSVEPDEETTRAHRGAKFGERVLDDINYQNKWVELSHQDARNIITFGTSYLLTGYELDFTETTKNAVQVLACETCEGDDQWLVSEGAVDEQTEDGALMFSGDHAKALVDAGTAAPKSDVFGNLSATVEACPHCQSPLKLRRANPDDGEQDILGLPLQKDIPLPKAFIRLYSDYDVFPIGNGRVKFGFLPEVTIESIVPIEWLMERYGKANKVKPVSMSTLGKEARWHPSGLSMWGYYGVSLSNDQERWVMHRITIRQPFIDTRPDPTNPDEIMSEPLGRLMISANDTVLFNGPLMVESQTDKGVFFPRMMLHPFQNEVELDSVHGNAAVDRLMDPQRSINAQLTQFEFDMSTMGSPRLAVDAGVNLEGQGDGLEADQSGYAGQILRKKGEGEIQVIQGTSTHDHWKELIQMRVEAMQRASNQSELDRGAAVQGAPSATAQITIGNRLDESRKPKGQRYAERNGRAWTHVLECVKGTYIDPRQLKGGYKSDKRAPRMWTATDLEGQSTVKVTVKPAHETLAFERQNTIELVQMNLLPMDTPTKILRIAKMLGMSQQLDPEPSQQLTQAENEFLDFMFGDPDPVAPVVKVRTDAHRLHYEKHMEDVRSPDGEPLSQWWSLHELATEGWYEQFMSMIEMEQVANTPVPAPSAIKNPIDGRTDISASIGTSEAWSYRLKAQEMMKQLPKNTEQRIFLIQSKMIMAYPDFQKLTQKRPSAMDPFVEEAIDPDGESKQRDIIMFTRWMAHCEGHDWADKKQQVQPSMGAKDVNALGQDANAPGGGASGLLSDVKPPQPQTLPGGLRPPSPQP